MASSMRCLPATSRAAQSGAQRMGHKRSVASRSVAHSVRTRWPVAMRAAANPGKSEQSTVDKLQAAETALADMFVPGAPQPRAKAVSLKRKEIKLLREQLMEEVEALMPPGSRNAVNGNGRAGPHNETVADRDLLRSLAEKPGTMTPEELQEIMRLEQENQELRQRATAALMRLDFLENLKAAMEEKQWMKENGIGEM